MDNKEPLPYVQWLGRQLIIMRIQEHDRIEMRLHSDDAHESPWDFVDRAIHMFLWSYYLLPARVCVSPSLAEMLRLRKHTPRLRPSAWPLPLPFSAEGLEGKEIQVRIDAALDDRTVIVEFDPDEEEKRSAMKAFVLDFVNELQKDR